MRNILIAVVIFIVLSVAGVYTYFSGKEYVVRITESQIQDKMRETLPLTKTYLFIFHIALDNPRVELTSGSDRIEAGLDMTLNIQLGNESKPLGGSVDVSGGIHYVAEEGSFYLTDPVIEQLSIQGVPQEYSERATRVIESALADYYSTHPAYQLKAGDIKQAAAKLVLRNVIIESEELVVTLGI